MADFYRPATRRPSNNPHPNSSVTSPYHTDTEDGEAGSLLGRSYRAPRLDPYAVSSAFEDNDDEDEDFIYSAPRTRPVDARNLPGWGGGFEDDTAVADFMHPVSAVNDYAYGIGSPPNLGSNYPYGMDPGFSSGGGGINYNTVGRSTRAWNAQSNFKKHKRWLKRRSGAYDEDGAALLQAGTGLRVWYDDYTTIDWIHDYVKERIRLRRLRVIKGVRGWLINSWDGMQGWMLMFFIGIASGCVAAGMDISTKWLSDLKQGYCQTDYMLNRSFCCWDYADKDSCSEWMPWSRSIANLFFGVQRTIGWAYYVDWLAYLIIAVIFAALSAALVSVTGTIHSVVPSTLLPATPLLNGGSQNKRSDKQKFFAAGSGVPEVKTILSGFVIRGFLGIQTLWVKVVALVLAVASGLAVGRQGPLVHICCCIGNVLCRFSRKYNKNEGKRREILSASSAAGVAVAFGAPIGGVLFSLEEVSYYFPSKTMWRSFFCALIAAMTLKVINPWHTGKLVLFQVTYVGDWHLFDLLGFALLGVLGGLYGAAFNRIYLRWIRSNWHNNFRFMPVREVIVVTAITALISYNNRFTRLELTELVARLFSECTVEDNLGGLCVDSEGEFYRVFVLLVYALCVKMIMTVVTLGLKIPAGLFIPSMAVGACFGRLLGLIVQHLYRTNPDWGIFNECHKAEVISCTMPGVYAMIGAAAALTGVTRMTVSLAVIMFELTGALTYLLPTMVAIMISKWVADGFSKQSIYDYMISLNGHPYLNAKKDYIRVGHTSEVMERGLEAIDVDEANTVIDLMAKLERMAQSGYTDGGFAILEGDRLVGYIAFNELEHAISKVRAKGEQVRCFFKRTAANSEGVTGPRLNDFTSFMDRAPLTVSQNASMDIVLELFMKLGLRYICVVRHGRYVGMIHKKRLLAYLKQLEDER